MTRRPTTWLLVAAFASAGAGLVHAAAAGSHNDDTSLAWLFAVTALLQLGWAALVVVRPWVPLVVGGIVLNGACVATWVLSRTVGLFGPLAGVEDVGTADTAAAVLATVACAAAVGALFLRSSTPPRIDRAVLVVCLVAIVALVVPAMAAPHTHSHDDGDHQHIEAAAATSPSHAHSDAHAHDDAVAVDDGAPIVSLADARLTEAQRSRAISLLVSTRAAMLARFPDRASVEAAGYVWIGDGRRAGGYEHFVQQDYMHDGLELDPAHIESIVLQRQPDGSERVVTAMYIMERGKTMADAPDIAGSLTTWHDHQNLCWDGNGRLAGIYVNGQCRPGGTFRPTAPMMHVWLTDPPCGPFAGVEGHGAGDCAHAHAAA